jgi:hypothetical protein
MNLKRIFFCALAVGVVALSVPTSTRADAWDKRTILTVNETIQVPGTVLPPGKYVLKLADSSSDRHIVQVFNEPDNHVMATVLAIPAYRTRVTGRTEFTWWEVPQGEPTALRSWFYPGDNFGQEFAYPKGKAFQLAAVNRTTVPSLGPRPSAEPAPAPPAPVEETAPAPPEPTRPVEEAPPQASNDSEPTLMAQSSPPPSQPAPPASTPEPAAKELPATASYFPLIGLAGLTLAGAGLGVHAMRGRRSA